MNAEPSTVAAKTNLLGLPKAELEAFVVALGEKPFRARQLMTWLYKRRVDDFAQMTDLSKAFREKLAAVAEVRLPEVVTEHASSDGTRKWLLRAGRSDGRDQAIEMVFIPEPGRGTLCISSQVGCALDCAFCSTGAQGFNRNLEAGEIVGQVWLANRLIAGPGPQKDTSERPVTNIVLMGMGEPLYNYENVALAMKIAMDGEGIGLSSFAGFRLIAAHGFSSSMRPRRGDRLALRRCPKLHSDSARLRVPSDFRHGRSFGTPKGWPLDPVRKCRSGNMGKIQAFGCLKSCDPRTSPAARSRPTSDSCSPTRNGKKNNPSLPLSTSVAPSTKPEKSEPGQT
mgnify:CR=1 FL=1